MARSLAATYSSLDRESRFVAFSPVMSSRHSHYRAAQGADPLPADAATDIRKSTGHSESLHGRRRKLARWWRDPRRGRRDRLVPPRLRCPMQPWVETSSPDSSSTRRGCLVAKPRLPHQLIFTRRVRFRLGSEIGSKGYRPANPREPMELVEADANPTVHRQVGISTTCCLHMRFSWSSVTWPDSTVCAITSTPDSSATSTPSELVGWASTRAPRRCAAATTAFAIGTGMFITRSESRSGLVPVKILITSAPPSRLRFAKAAADSTLSGSANRKIAAGIASFAQYGAPPVGKIPMPAVSSRGPSTSPLSSRSRMMLVFCSSEEASTAIVTP